MYERMHGWKCVPADVGHFQMPRCRGCSSCVYATHDMLCWALFCLCAIPHVPKFCLVSRMCNIAGVLLHVLCKCSYPCVFVCEVRKSACMYVSKYVCSMYISK